MKKGSVIGDRESGIRRGSALLIVLGMVAFMVVSAVSFAFFMRQNRVPSSYLRRTTAMRQLAKAALAKAMKEIDDAVANNPYPGIGGAVKDGTGQVTGVGKNYWRGRVLCPDGLVDQSSTFATLTLEGLAYLPPAIVNDVRYYARRTSTARWQRLDYDAGRYAFTVVNVSDFLDVNRLEASDARNGSGGRIAVTPLFEKDGLTGFWSEPEDFQDFLDKARDEMPFVSLADYNLALKSVGGAGFESPFVNYFVTGGGAGFYGFEEPPNNKGEANYLKYGAQRFVADSLISSVTDEWIDKSTVNAGLKKIDLSDARNQPFDGFLDLKDDEKKNDRTANQVLMAYDSCPWGTDHSYKIGPYEWAALYDYLDKDDVPCSVALPTVERAPMVVGVEQVDESVVKVKIQKDDPNPGGNPDNPNGNERWVRRTVTYYFEFDGGQIQLNVGLAFPFKYRKELNDKKGNYKVRAVGNLYLIRQADRMKTCRTSSDSPAIGNWSTSASQNANMNDGIFTLVSDTKTVKLPSDEITSEDVAVSGVNGNFHDVQLTFKNFDNANGKLKDEQYLAKFNLRRKEVKDPDTGNWIPATDATGQWHEDTDKGGYDYKFRAADFASGGPTTHPRFDEDYVWGFSCAIKVFDGNEQLVDMAPASFADDMQPNQGGDFGGYHKNAGRPVLRFDGDGSALNLKKEWADMDQYYTALSNSEMPLGLKPMRYLTDDPRYNFAAENWYVADDLETDGTMGKTWLKHVSTGSKDWQDHDIFMSVSNQGYLQDGAELAFLPCAKQFDAGGDFNTVERGNGNIPQNRDQVLHKNLMWRTHDCIDGGVNGTDALKLSAGGDGYRISPYSDDEFITRLPFVDTPYDWWAAGTNAANDVVKAKFINSQGLTDDLDAALKYTFGPRSESAAARIKAEKLVPRLNGATGDDVQTISGSIMRTLRGSTAWYDAWRNDIDWDATGESLCGVDGLGVPLHDVDRKFLYGYWRGCFANLQQLYIVFFRAESTMLGGGEGGAASAAASMGSRGVAVVWRNPYAAASGNDEDDTPPHAMRILYYHQFE